jgi:hypothetical protein
LDNTLKIEDRFPVAYHEAAHAIAIVALHGFVERAFIRRDFSKPYADSRGRKSDCIGMVEGGKFYSPLGLTRRNKLHMLDSQRDHITKFLAANMKREIIKCLAGPWAEADLRLPQKMNREDRRWSVRSCRGFREDYVRSGLVLKELQALTGRGALRRFEDEVFQFVCCHRVAITDVAQELVKKNELEHEQIAEICKQQSVTIDPFTIQHPCLLQNDSKRSISGNKY